MVIYTWYFNDNEKGTKTVRRYVEKIESILTETPLDIHEDTYAAVEGLRVIYAHVDGKERLIVDGNKSFRFKGDIAGGKSGIRVCPMDHENRVALNRDFAYTAPTALGRDIASFGCGDRLGIAGIGQVRAIAKTKVRPVLAQQSLRELSLTGRTYEDILDAASWAVFKSGYKGGYGADGDHLKSLEEIEAALDHGVSMITLDCSLVLEDVPEDEKERAGAYAQLPADYRERVEKEYLQDEELRDLGIDFDQATLENTVLVYRKAVDLATEVYQLIKKKRLRVDLEISLDETTHTTDLTAHYFVANELDENLVKINSLAPRFVGEFQKAIDYIGDVDAFQEDLRAHCKIADHFGYKISIHSGSDKFMVFPSIARETRGRFHLKTSGTSWLEAVRVISQCDPALYRDMHQAALENLDRARAFYAVHCDTSKIRPLDEVADEDLPKYMQEDDARQLLHITYGYMLKENEEIHSRICKVLREHADAYTAALEKHIEKHLHLLGCV